MEKREQGEGGESRGRVGGGPEERKQIGTYTPLLSALVMTSEPLDVTERKVAWPGGVVM